MKGLALDILQRLYEIDAPRLESLLTKYDLPNWAALVQQLDFMPWDTGGGCMMLIADVPGDQQ